MAAGAEANELRRIGGVGRLGVVVVFERVDVNQDFGRGGFAGERGKFGHASSR